MITDWNPLFTAQAGAFAALTGLVFVALSINLKQILNSPGLPGRAGEAVIVLVEPVLIGLLGLLPHQSVRTLGSELLVIAIVGWAAVTTIMVSNATRCANVRASRSPRASSKSRPRRCSSSSPRPCWYPATRRGSTGRWRAPGSAWWPA